MRLFGEEGALLVLRNLIVHAPGELRAAGVPANRLHLSRSRVIVYGANFYFLQSPLSKLLLSHMLYKRNPHVNQGDSTTFQIGCQF